VLLAVQLLFAEFYASAQDDAGVRLNVAAFTWFADHRDEICQRFMGTLDDTF
jgi:hypothetical protein